MSTYKAERLMNTKLSNPGQWTLIQTNVVRLAEAPSYDYDVVIARCTPC